MLCLADRTCGAMPVTAGTALARCSVKSKNGKTSDQSEQRPQGANDPAPKAFAEQRERQDADNIKNELN